LIRTKNLQNIEWKIRGAVYSANIEVKNNQNKENDPGIYAMVMSCSGGELSGWRVVIVASCQVASCQSGELSGWRVFRVASCHTVKKVCGSWNQKLYIGEYSGIYSLKLKNSGIYNLRFAPSWIYSWIFRKSFLRCSLASFQGGEMKSDEL
jgi:hypothetical protein